MPEPLWHRSFRSRTFSIVAGLLLSVTGLVSAFAQGAAASGPNPIATSGQSMVGASDEPLAPPATARTGGKLVLTGGVSQVEGAAGGGLTPWALIAGNGVNGQLGGNGFATYLRTQDFALTAYGLALGVSDRIELSLAHQSFDTRDAGAKLGLGGGYTFGLDVIGVKARLIGDAVLDSDRWLPQIAAGLQFKRSDRGDTVRTVGAAHAQGVDAYVSATKLLLAQSVLINATVRATKANQFGLLGFGGDRSDQYRAQFEGSLAYLLSRSVALGVELRTKPDNLAFAREQNAYDVFVAWALSPNLSLTAAYVELGDIATFRNQHGAYLSAQVSF